MVKYTFSNNTEGIYLHTRSGGKHYNLSQTLYPIRATTKIRKVLIRDMLFADDAGIVAPSEESLQSLMNNFSKVREDFQLTISL